MSERRPVTGIDGYEVGDDGSFWSCWEGRGTARKTVDRWLKLSVSVRPDGYSCVNMNVRGRRYNKLLHRVVLESFYGPCPPGMEGCHKDGNKSNNSLSNLQWKTHKGNEDDKISHGTRPSGEKHGRSKLSQSQVDEIRSRKGEAFTSLGREFGVHRIHIGQIVKGRYWTKHKES